MKFSKDEFEIIVKICERAEALDIAPKERITLIMDLDNAHQAVRLNLKGLLDADDSNFVHDICGIQANINRETKELDNCFLPRYAAQENVDVDKIINNAKFAAEEHNRNADKTQGDFDKEFSE